MKSYELRLDNLEPLVSMFSSGVDNSVIILKGDLAAGKTTLVKAVAKGLGVDDEVTSPTFSLQQCYGKSIYHYDMYNHGLEHFLSLGMLEELEKDGLHFVEWGDDELVNILVTAGISTIVIEIEKTSNESRTYRVDDAHA